MSSNIELKIYNNYRAALSSYSRLDFSHAAQRRQKARQVTVDRYNVPFAEVKRIVAEYDALNGVTHEQGQDYAYKLQYEAAIKACEANPVPCKCGSTEMVRPRFNKHKANGSDTFDISVFCYMCYRVM